ncbi:MBL fold metallo-hydrolase [Actinomadura fibrosa]|nr:MBL fold metallo-hydrolase [Actinomadura fibrosa]
MTVIGSGDAFGSGGRLQTCLHLRASGDEGTLLIDCGATALTGLKRYGCDPAEVAVVAVSHLHGDHFAGLPFLILDGQFRRRTRPLHLVGPPGLDDRLHQAMEVLFPGSTSVTRRFAVHVHETPPGSDLTLGTCHVQAFAVDHQAGAPALALRVTLAGRTIAYSGDTAWTDTLLTVADGTDLFVCEAYTADRAVPGHLHLPDLVSHAAQLRCRRLLLTHAGPSVLDQPLAPHLTLAHDGMTIDL